MVDFIKRLLGSPDNSAPEPEVGIMRPPAVDYVMHPRVRFWVASICFPDNGPPAAMLVTGDTEADARKVVEDRLAYRARRDHTVTVEDCTNFIEEALR